MFFTGKLARSREKVTEKMIQVQGKVREFYLESLESRKIEIIEHG